MDKDKEDLKESDINNKDDDNTSTLNNQDICEDKNEETTESTESYEDLKEKLKKEQEISKDYLNKLQRAVADFDNFRKRTNIEKASLYESGYISVIEKLLPIYDNFERAINSTPEEDKTSNTFKGLEMIYKQFTDLFNTLEIKEIEALEQNFDPNFHNAVMHIEDENIESNIVVEVLQKGYKYKDKVIRASMVKVAN